MPIMAVALTLRSRGPTNESRVVNLGQDQSEPVLSSVGIDRESGLVGLRNRYPTHGSVRMYFGLAGSSSIFLRKILM